MTVSLETSNYWDDFIARAEKFINNKPITLDRLTVHLTSVCNLKCKYCNMKKTCKTMDREIVSKIITEYSTMGGKIIHFTGGEPSIVSYVDDMITEAYTHGLKVSINTNAVTPFKDISKISKLKCSLDDFRSSSLDDLYGIPGIFENIYKTLRYYSDNVRKDQVFSITCVLSQKNFYYMRAIAAYIRKHFPNVYNVYFSIYKGNDPEFLLSESDVDHIRQHQIPKVIKLFELLKDDYSKKQVAIYERNDFVDGIRFPENDNIPCYLQMSELTIGVDCKIYNCSHLYRDGILPIRDLDIRTNSLQECFTKAKKTTVGKVPLSNYCLTGCNRNLCNFNKYVHMKKGVKESGTKKSKDNKIIR